MNNITLTADSIARSRSAGGSFWRDTLAAFSVSGQSVGAFCQARGLKVPTFYAWRLKLAKGDREENSSTPARPRSAWPALVPVVVEPLVGGVEESIQVELRGGRMMRLPASMPAGRLAEVLHALEGQA